MGAAYASYEEHRKGSLTPGKLADLVVLDRDIFSIDPMEIAETQVARDDDRWAMGVAILRSRDTVPSLVG